MAMYDSKEPKDSAYAGLAQWAFDKNERIQTVVIDGVTYSTQSLNRIRPKEHFPDAIEVTTLSALIEYIKNPIIAESWKGKANVIHVVSPTLVLLMTQTMGVDNDVRRAIVTCKAKLPAPFAYEKFHDLEDFNILMQSRFENKGDRDTLLKLTAKVCVENMAEMKDNGTTQVVTIKQGVGELGPEKMPNPVRLAPFRTFTECLQPESPFIFRLNKDGQAALFPCDGGKWEIMAIEMIKYHLADQLKDCGIVILG